MSSDIEPRTPFLQQIRTFGSVFWVANWMELVERFAYYGVRTALPVFMVLAVSQGGPGISLGMKADIFAMWALVQSFVPIFTGGFADRYGFKVNIAIATVLKIFGYLLMGYCIVLAEAWAGTDLRTARENGTDNVVPIFYAGAMLLALGTAVFKPGLQGLIATKMPKESSSMGWGIFYQMVNIGGFVGPLVAGYLRVLDWTQLFLVCAIGVALNFIPLFFFEEPVREASVATKKPLAIAVDAVKGLLEPRLFFFTMAFAGFWLMFYQLFDLLPNFIDDWVDSRGANAFLTSIVGDDMVPDVQGGNLTQEWIINVNALLISIFAFLVGYVTGRLRSLTSIFIGIAISAGGIYALGMSMSGWWTIGAIAFFSIGEMMASPTKMRYLSSIAPPGKQGLYMGYVNMTVGIGWSIGSLVGGGLYERDGDKVTLARRYLVEQEGMSGQAVEAIERGEVMALFERTVNVDAWGARDLLWTTYEPYHMWLVFTLIGLGSMVLLVIYDVVVRKAAAEPQFSFNTHGVWWVRIALVPITLALTVVCIQGFKLSLAVLAAMFGMLFVASFFYDSRKDRDKEESLRPAADAADAPREAA